MKNGDNFFCKTDDEKEFCDELDIVSSIGSLKMRGRAFSAYAAVFKNGIKVDGVNTVKDPINAKTMTELWNIIGNNLEFYGPKNKIAHHFIVASGNHTIDKKYHEGPEKTLKISN